MDPDDIIPIGYKPGIYVYLLCTKNGLRNLPEPISVLLPDQNGYYGVTIATTKENLVAMRLAGVIFSQTGMSKILKLDFDVNKT